MYIIRILDENHMSLRFCQKLLSPFFFFLLHFFFYFFSSQQNSLEYHLQIFCVLFRVKGDNF